MTDRSEWVWMPHAAHFIAANRCHYHLATYLGNGYLVSTIGEYRGRGDDEGEPWGEIGSDRLYETMVFRAVPNNECPSCGWAQESGENLDFDGYNDGGAAYDGHQALCEKWAAEDAR